MRVLLIEDEYEANDVINDALSAEFYTSTVHSYEAAIKIAKTFKFDVIIADIYLKNSEKNGDDFCVEYLEKCPECKIFLITGNPEPKIRDFKFEELYTKPFSIDLLVQDIKEIEMNDRRSLDNNPELKNIHDKIGTLTRVIEDNKGKDEENTKLLNSIYGALIGTLEKPGLITKVENNVKEIKTNRDWLKWMGASATSIVLAAIITLVTMRIKGMF